MHPAPILVLVAPQDIVNIGGAVRIAKNFGLSRIRLVTPETYDPWRVEGIAHNTGDLIDRLTIHDSLDQAIADCVWTVALTARERTAKRGGGAGGEGGKRTGRHRRGTGGQGAHQ
jgi:tRNA/rRNA methyltransferase/tRNA (cytidine32/uridine32-2'-O)-methyltransferase